MKLATIAIHLSSSIDYLPLQAISPNGSSVSEVQPLGWIWAKVLSTEARYALLYVVGERCLLFMILVFLINSNNLSHPL